jgi:hypothetical protein
MVAKSAIQHRQQRWALRYRLPHSRFIKGHQAIGLYRGWNPRLIAVHGNNHHIHARHIGGK